MPRKAEQFLSDPVYTKHEGSNVNGKEFICGWGAAFVNITLTFPINKIMFRQMLHGIHSQKAISQLRHEGLRFLYRGILPPLCQKTASVSLMFGMYEQYRIAFATLVPVTRLHPNANRTAAAFLAGCTEALLTPFERVQTLMQDRHYHGRFRNTVHAFGELRRFGFREYYRGFLPVLVRNGFSNVVFFTVREETMRRVGHPDGTSNWWEGVVRDFLCGGAIGAVISTIFYPLNVVKTHMQSKLGGRFEDMGETYRAVVKERGGKPMSLMRGVHVNYTRALISWGVINASYEMLKRVL